VRSLNQALVATEVTYYPELWQANTQLLQHFAQNAAGIRCCGAAAVNLCHLASGVVDTYYQYMLKPWDVAAGVLIAEEAGGRVSTADGLAYSVFDRSLLATNDALYPEMLAQTEPLTSKVLERKMIDLGPWCIPEGYKLRAGAQLG
jgi:myo-inositol-1(or 4)-monophosphatase